MKLLHIDSSVLAEHSVSRQLTARIVADLKSFSNEGRPPTELADLNSCLQHAVSVVGTPPAGIQLHTSLAPLPQLACELVWPK